jgi:Ca2+:H+ antiporter
MTSMPRRVLSSLRAEWPLYFNAATAVIVLADGQYLLDDLSHPVRFALALTWVVLIVLFSAFAVVRHAEQLAARLGEPLGTLILTLAVTGIEVMIIVATMSTGNATATLARDAMFAIVMIVLNGLVGLTLLIGGLRYHEQDYNLQGASAFLAVILPLAVIALVLPSFTTSAPDQAFSPIQAAVWAFVSAGLYAVFLAIQNVRHRAYFQSIGPDDATDAGLLPNARRGSSAIAYHTVLVIIYMVLLVLLSKQIAVPIDFTIRVLGAPVALAGLLVAVLVLSPEAFSALRAAFANDLQRSVNILLGSALATSGLTIPAVLAFGLLTNRNIILGLDPVDMTMLALTLLQSTITFSSTRTNVLLGAVHLLLFSVYLLLIFQR